MPTTTPSGTLPGPARPELFQKALAPPPAPRGALPPGPDGRGGWPEDVHLPERDEDAEC